MYKPLFRSRVFLRPALETRQVKEISFHASRTPTTISSMSTVHGDASALFVGSVRFADVAINLSDPVFRGIYHGKTAHEDDLRDVIQRAVDVGCIKLMVTGSDLEESRKAVEMAEDHRMFITLLSPSKPSTVELFID